MECRLDDLDEGVTALEGVHDRGEVRSAFLREIGVVMRSVTARQKGPSRVTADRDLIGNHRLVHARRRCGSADHAAQELGSRAVVRG